MTLPGSPLSRQRFQSPRGGWADTFSLILRMIVGGVLFYAGFMKAMGPSAEFAATIEAYKILPATLITPLAQALPWIEMGIGTFLFFGYVIRVSAAVAAILFAVFMSAMTSALVRGIILASCGCFGADTLPPHTTLMIDGGLLVASLWLVFKSPHAPYLSFDYWIEKGPTTRR